MPEHEATGKQIASEYREQRTEYNPDDVNLHDLQAKRANGPDALQVDYSAPNGQQKSVRGNNPRRPGRMEGPKDTELEGLVFGHETKYHLTPDGELRTAPYNSNGQRLAEPDDVWNITGVTFPDSVPTVGAVQEDVTATVYYRSNQSGNVKSVDVETGRIEGHCSDFRTTGEEVDGDRRFEIWNANERLLKRTGYRERRLGRVVRIEFPAGHQFTVQFKNMTDEKAERLADKGVVENKLQQLADSSRDKADVEVNVQHDGRIQLCGSAESPSSRSD